MAYQTMGFLACYFQCLFRPMFPILSFHGRRGDACMHTNLFFIHKSIPEIEQHTYVHIDGLGSNVWRSLDWILLGISSSVWQGRDAEPSKEDLLQHFDSYVPLRFSRFIHSSLVVGPCNIQLVSVTVSARGFIVCVNIECSIAC